MILFLILGVAKRENEAVIGDIEILIGFKYKVNNLCELLLNLLGSYEKVGVVLTEMSSPFNTLKRT